MDLRRYWRLFSKELTEQDDFYPQGVRIAAISDPSCAEEYNTGAAAMPKNDNVKMNARKARERVKSWWC